MHSISNLFAITCTIIAITVQHGRRLPKNFVTVTQDTVEHIGAYFRVPHNKTEHTLITYNLRKHWKKSNKNSKIKQITAKKLKIWRTFGEEDMPDFIEIIVIRTKVINHTTDRLQQRTEHGWCSNRLHGAARTTHTHNDGTITTLISDMQHAVKNTQHVISSDAHIWNDSFISISKRITVNTYPQ